MVSKTPMEPVTTLTIAETRTVASETAGTG
jgi:hypothetical protein